MKKNHVPMLFAGLLAAGFLASCASTPAGPKMVDTYGFDTGIKASQTVDGVTVTAQYVATDAWDWIRKNNDLEAMLTVPVPTFHARIEQDKLLAYEYAAFPLRYGSSMYFMPTVANINAYLITITNNTKGTIKMKDLRVGFITSDGERFNNMGRDKAKQWILEAVRTEVAKQQQALSSNWTPTMAMYIADLLLDGNTNRKFKVINDPEAEIYPGETFKGFALFDGGITYDTSKKKVTYLDNAKLGIYEVPVQVDDANAVVKKGEFVFNVKKVSVDANTTAPSLAAPETAVVK